MLSLRNERLTVNKHSGVKINKPVVTKINTLAFCLDLFCETINLNYYINEINLLQKQSREQIWLLESKQLKFVKTTFEKNY